MTWEFLLRDRFKSRRPVIGETKITEGSKVLDYGCGPGIYTFYASEIVGPDGRIFAVDIHPMAVKRVQKETARREIGNIRTILTDCRTGQSSESIDVILLYDTFHDISQKEALLNELHRILKPAGELSFNDHHMNNAEILDQVTGSGLFALEDIGTYNYSFRKV